MISAADFLRATNERGKAGGASAFIVDFGGVQNIDDPTIDRALRDHFRQASGEVTDQVARLGRHELACLCPNDMAARLDQAVAELDEIVRDQGLGAVRADRYVLPRDGRALAERVRAIVGGADPAVAAGLRRNRRNDLAHLLKIEQMLRRTDISSLIHHQALYDFARPRNPVTLARELTVSMQRLSEMLGVAVVDNPWLFDKITQLLDRRMLFHLVQERSRHAEPYAVNLRVATVLGSGFTDLIGRLAAQEHETLIVELPQADRGADGQAFDAAVEELERLGIHSAFHAGGWDDLAAMADGEDARILREIDFLKVRWDPTDLDLTGAETTAIKALVERVGAQRVVLERAEDEAAVQFAHGVGVRLLQGFGVTEHVRTMHEKERDRAVARVRRAARQGAAEPAEPAKPVAGNALRKMFRL